MRRTARLHRPLGLARLKMPGLVRIGDPQRRRWRPWRYGDQFGRRGGDSMVYQVPPRWCLVLSQHPSVITPASGGPMLTCSLPRTALPAPEDHQLPDAEHARRVRLTASNKADLG